MTKKFNSSENQISFINLIKQEKFEEQPSLLEVSVSPLKSVLLVGVWYLNKGEVCFPCSGLPQQLQGIKTPSEEM